MDENHQDNTEGNLTATKDKSTPSSLSPQDQRGIHRLQNHQMEETIKQLRERGYKVTEEYSKTGLSKISGEQPQRKTGWDWFQLVLQLLGVIAIPLAIFLGTTYFSAQQNQVSMQIANDQQQEAMLKAYLEAKP